MENYLTYENNKYRLTIDFDTLVEDPRRGSEPLGKLICFTRSGIGDEHDYDSPMEAIGDILDDCDIDFDYYSLDTAAGIDKALKDLNEFCVVKPVYKYEHSNIKLSYAPFTDSWDSCHAGYMYVPVENIKRLYGTLDDMARIDIMSILEGDLSVYNMYINGEVLCYTLEEKEQCTHCNNIDYTEIDCGYGFFGMEPKTNGLLESIGINKAELTALLDNTDYIANVI